MNLVTSIGTSSHVQGRQLNSSSPYCRKQQMNCKSKVVNGVRSTAASGKGLTGNTSLSDVIEDDSKYVLQTYARPKDFMAVRGEGCLLYDSEGKSYLDFAAGIAVNCLGHSHPAWVQAVQEQADQLVHVSNLYYQTWQTDLAKKLVTNTPWADKAYFCNSGAEANEGAIKFARKYARVQANIDPYDMSAEAPYEIVSFSKSFHGRLYGCLSITDKPRYQAPFKPMLQGSKVLPFLDKDAASNAIKKGQTAAVFVEPVQGEGGVNLSTIQFLTHLRQLCDEAGALLVFDEVQCGLGRTGKLWGHQNFDVVPDMMSVAKPLAGGLPMGCVLMTDAVADVMSPGDHGSTFAGAPLVAKAACSVMDILTDDQFLADVASKGALLKQLMTDGLKDNKHVQEVRGLGLMVGIQCDQPAGAVVDAARAKGLITITAGAGDVIRLVPPLVVSKEQIEEAASVLCEAINTTLE